MSYLIIGVVCALNLVLIFMVLCSIYSQLARIAQLLASVVAEATVKALAEKYRARQTVSGERSMHGKDLN
jgi:outer membrane lipoprotein-sorting protein